VKGIFGGIYHIALLTTNISPPLIKRFLTSLRSKIDGLPIPIFVDFRKGSFAYQYVPRTQMTRVLIVKGHLLEGWIPKIEDKQVRGICRDCHHLPFQVLVDSIFWRLKPVWWDSWTKALWRGFRPTFEGPVCRREKRSEILGVLAYPLRRCGLFSRERSNISHQTGSSEHHRLKSATFLGDMWSFPWG